MSTDLSIFSNETLDSIAMAEVIGGEAANNCQGGNCGNCVAGCACGSDTGVCGDITANVTGGCLSFPKQKQKVQLSL